MDTPPLILAAFDERYLIERELGSGGMAIVYLARDRKLDREVALKVLRPELGAVLGSERFLAEIKISARLDHPHILTLIDSGDADGFLYYVLPYVRGESLRSKLDREHQLSIEDAVSITKQVASALDYAHRQGLVHRDIKPENILIQEGEAMLADFGIALAVKEAGGNRLTQTGLSLGTPQYMSPEQATGDRGIDARSDVYSLAAVFYEMIAGEPPVSGGSAQSMIAKLMTEKPTSLRVLRDSVTPAMDAAVAKALSKTPADRFPSAGDFMRALATSTTAQTASVPVQRNRKLIYTAAGTAVVAGLAAAVFASGKFSDSPRAVLGEKKQLTTSGAVRAPAISPDGKQLAYITKKCETGTCRYSVVVQDVGSTVTRTILDNATAGYGMEWSPDRRNLLFGGTIDGRSGVWILSAGGAAPRLVGKGSAAFYADGDSLIVAPPMQKDSAHWMKITSLDGIVHDSIRVSGEGMGLASVAAVPGTNWILTLIPQPPRGLWQIVRRDGKVLDKVVNACTCGGLATNDAVWLARSGSGNGESIVRIALDRSTGKLAPRQDTMISGLFTNFSVTADGSAMLLDEGIYDYSNWALEWPDLLKAKFPEERRIARASSPVIAEISPDGNRLLMRRTIPLGGERAERRFSVMPYPSGAEAAVSAPGVQVGASWSDSVTVALATRVGSRMNFTQVDVRTGAQRNKAEVPDSVVPMWDALPGGWVYVPRPLSHIHIRQGADTRKIPRPAIITRLHNVVAEESGEGVFLIGLDADRDSVMVARMDLRDGSVQPWAKLRVEGAALTPLKAGGFLVRASETQGVTSLFRLSAPGKLERFWVSPSPVDWVSASADMKRATAVVVEYRADAWLNKVVRPK